MVVRARLTLRKERSNLIMTKELLFSVTRDDCIWKYTIGTGTGGQKKQKTSSAVHCTHKLSGAHGYSEATRSQAQNRSDAFRKMTETKTLQLWHKLETARRLGNIIDIDKEVDRSMKFIKTEIKEDGKWKVVDDEYFSTPEE